MSIFFTDVTAEPSSKLSRIGGCGEPLPPLPFPFPNPPFPPSREAEEPTGPEPLGVAALISTLLPPTTWSFPDPRARGDRGGVGDGSGLVLTVGKYFTPSGTDLDREGLAADLQVVGFDASVYKKLPSALVMKSFGVLIVI